MELNGIDVQKGMELKTSCPEIMVIRGFLEIHAMLCFGFSDQGLPSEKS